MLEKHGQAFSSPFVPCEVHTDGKTNKLNRFGCNRIVEGFNEETMICSREGGRIANSNFDDTNIRRSIRFGSEDETLVRASERVNLYCV